MGKSLWSWKVKVYKEINDYLNNAIIEDDEVVNDVNYFTSEESKSPTDASITVPSSPELSIDLDKQTEAVCNIELDQDDAIRDTNRCVLDSQCR